MSLALLVGAAAFFVLPLASTFAPAALLVALYTAATAPVVAFATSATMFMLGDEREAYGRIRPGGTIGFGAAALAGGMLVERYGLRPAFWGCAALTVVTLVVSQKLIYGPSAGRLALRGGVRSLLGDRRWLLFPGGGLCRGPRVGTLDELLLPLHGEAGRA